MKLRQDLVLLAVGKSFPRENTEVLCFRANVWAVLTGELAEQVSSGFELLALWLLSTRARAVFDVQTCFQTFLIEKVLAGLLLTPLPLGQTIENSSSA